MAFSLLPVGHRRLSTSQVHCVREPPLQRRSTFTCEYKHYDRFTSIPSPYLLLPGYSYFRPDKPMVLLTELRSGGATKTGWRSPVYEPSQGNSVSLNDCQTARSILILPIPSRYLVDHPVSHKDRVPFLNKDIIMHAPPTRHWDYPSARNTSRLTYLRSQSMSGYQQSGESSRSQDEDWRHIEDPGERRRIQNRIAQRKYRELYFCHYEDSFEG